MSGIMEGLGLTPITNNGERERAEQTFAACPPLVELQPTMSHRAYELLLIGIMQAEADADAAWEAEMSWRVFNGPVEGDENA